MNQAYSSDDIEKLFTSTPATQLIDELDNLALRLLDLRETEKAVKAEIKVIEDAIWSRCPDEPGEFEVEGKQYKFDVTRNETFKWDEVNLLGKVNGVTYGSPVPAFVKVKIGVDKKLYDAASQQDQDLFSDALTRAPGKAKVTPLKKV